MASSELQEQHTPAELLETAESLHQSGKPEFQRTALLEAITALESFVFKTLFSNLERQFPANFVRWLEEKTRFDFDSRLSVLAPLVTGLLIEKNSDLWSNYKRAKQLRNDVTHTGRRVSESDAKFVIDTVYTWIAFLDSAVESSTRSHLSPRAFKLFDRLSRFEQLIYRLSVQLNPRLASGMFNANAAIHAISHTGNIDRKAARNIATAWQMRHKFLQDPESLSAEELAHFQSLLETNIKNLMEAFPSTVV